MAESQTLLKKAYCTKCKTDDEMNRIFVVNPDADICYCPSCMAQWKPKDAIDNYNYFLSTKINKADRLLFRDTKFYESYCAYGKILEIDDTSFRARYGRILALIYMSTLRKSYFDDAALLLKSEAEQYFRKNKDYLSYTKFLHKINIALNEYFKRFMKRLTIRERFYSEDCVELYYARLYEIINLKKLVLEELNRLSSKYSGEILNRVINEVEYSLTNLEKGFEKKAVTTDGRRFKLEKVLGRNRVQISKMDNKLSPFVHFVKYKLNEKDKKGKLISNKVYPDNSHISSLIKGSIPLFIIFLAAGTAVLLYYLFFAKEQYRLPSFIISIALYSGALLSLILFVVWKIQLRKRHHLID